MKKVVLLLAACMCANLLFSQNLIIMAKSSDKWKYVDIKGNVVIEGDFPIMYSFTEEGVAVVYYPKKKQYAIIDAKGQTVPTEVQNYVLKDAFGLINKGFSGGMLNIAVDKKWGCLDPTGKLVVPLKYTGLTEFDNGYGTGKIDTKFFVIAAGKEIPVDASIIDLREFHENLAPFKTAENKHGFVDINGKIVIPARFISVGYFNNGLAWAKEADGTFGYINPAGEWVIKPQFAGAKDFDKESGLARIKKDDKWQYINMKGDLVALDGIVVVDDFFEGLAKGKKDEQVGFYNNKGEWVIKPQFRDARDFKNGYAAAKSGELWGVIDRQGNWVIQPTFEAIKDVIKIK